MHIKTLVLFTFFGIYLNDFLYELYYVHPALLFLINTAFKLVQDAFLYSALVCYLPPAYVLRVFI
jgi:hypothetical protein